MIAPNALLPNYYALQTAREIQLFAEDTVLWKVGASEKRVAKLGDGDWNAGVMETVTGTACVYLSETKAIVVLFVGNDETDRREVSLSTFWEEQPDGAMKRVDEDELGDSDFSVMTRGIAPDTKSVEMDQFYYNGGFLRLECSDDLPAEMMAEALRAAWKVLRQTTDRVVGGIDVSRAHA